MRELSRKDISDLLLGATILGTGGGGEPDQGFELIDRAIAAGKTFKLASLDEGSNDERICTPFMLGAISALPEEEEKLYEGVPRASEEPILIAYERLQAYMDCSFSGFVPAEMGGWNTALAFYIAAMTGGYTVDADPTGRAVPEITHSTYYFNDLPAAPIVGANEFGECFILENMVDDSRCEMLLRGLAKASRNSVAGIDHPFTKGELKHALIHGSMSMALNLGLAFRTAKENGDNVAETVAKTGNGKVVFQGEVSGFDFRTEGGFTLGHIDIEGNADFQGDQYHVNVKNENMYSKLNGQVHVTIPDLICMIDMEKQLPITNPNHQIGMQVAVVVLPAPKEYLNEKGLKAFGPGYVGLDMPYQPAIKG